ncbi:MAG TPA: RsiV family protein, partial [Pseudoxanthomonas sp.]
SVRADADELPPAERLEFVRNADKMIDEGTEPDIDNFSQFQPIVGADGKVTALRFVFPPYQVGPYADGTQTVDVPAAVLLPHVAPEYAGLFAKS